MNVHLSMCLKSIKYPNFFKLRPGEEIEQELVIQNDGMHTWPQDAYLIYTAQQNQLKVIEEIKLGAVEPKSCTEILIPIKMPLWFPDNQDRYILEYQMRYNFSTIPIGEPMKFVFKINESINTTSE